MLDLGRMWGTNSFKAIGGCNDAAKNVPTASSGGRATSASMVTYVAKSNRGQQKLLLSQDGRFL